MAPKRKVAQQLPVVAPAISAPAPEPSTKKRKTPTAKPTQVGELVSLISNKTGTTVAQSRALIEALRDITVEELLSNHVVKMPGMVSLKAVPLPAKEERKKSAFGKVVTIPPKAASIRIRFVAAAHLLSALKPEAAAAS